MSKEGLAALRASHEDWLGVLRSLTPEEAAQPSDCAGWRVQDVVAHLGSNLKLMVEPEPTPAAPAGTPPARAEELMEALVEPRRAWPWERVLEEYERYAAPALQAVEAMQDEPVASTALPIADLGTYAMHQLADAYAFDHWCHLRVDMLRPLGPLEREVPPPDDVRLAPAVGWMLAGIPQMCREQLAFLDRPVALRLDGPGGGAWAITPPGADGLVGVEPGEASRTDATVASSAADFVVWGTKRRNWRDRVRLSGDEGLATRFLDALNIV